MSVSPFIRTAPLALAALLVWLPPPAAHADDEAPVVSVELSRLPEHGPYKARLTLRAHQAREVATDRRLLQLTVRPKVEGRRRSPRLRCRHPAAPSRRPRSRQMQPGETYEEWVDLRMYCWGRALRALEGGEATIEVVYGFRRGGRDRYVAREEGERRPPRSIEGTALEWTPPPETEPEGEEPPVELGMRPTSSRGAPPFRPTIRATEGRPRVYLRDDLWSFEVRGPLGRVICQPQRQVVAPIVDFYTRLSSRRRTSSFDPDYYCPEDTFSVPGVYEIVPRIDLIYDADRFDFDAVTGTFVGEPVPVRVTRGDYVEQTMESLQAVNAP